MGSARDRGGGGMDRAEETPAVEGIKAVTEITTMQRRPSPLRTAESITMASGKKVHNFWS